MISRILVACERMVLSGGLLRFERLGRALAKRGVSLSYVCAETDDLEDWTSDFEIIHGFSLAEDKQWDVIMVPGAGFSDKTIAALRIFSKLNGATRVQHVLNDQSRRDRFLFVNRVFEPDLVVFNNNSWPSGSYDDFQAKSFSTIIGAVDTNFFNIPFLQKTLSSSKNVIIGGLANKNSHILLDCIRRLPDRFKASLIGCHGQLADEYSDMIASSRLELLGIVGDKGLLDFFQKVDIAVHMDSNAGWANFAAESLSCRVPLICTRHGTNAFASHLETSFVLAELSSENLLSAIEFMVNNPQFVEKMCRLGRSRISKYTWDNYCHEMVSYLEKERNICN